MEEIKKLKDLNDNPTNLEGAAFIMRNLLIASHSVKSIRRAFKRGRFTHNGNLIPHRPFNNRKNTSKRRNADSRFVTTEKKRVYEYVKRIKREPME
jgi:hypothetical protein